MYNARQLTSSMMSHLIRGAWIEIDHFCKIFDWNYRRISYEVRGLKCFFRCSDHVFKVSHLIRGAWIEIFFKSSNGLLNLRRISYEVRGLKFF